MKRTIKLVALLLLGMLFSGFILFMLPPSVQENLEQRKSEIFLAEIEAALSRFQIDHGNYPENRGDPIDGAAVLFDALVENETVYLRAGKNEDFTIKLDGQWHLTDFWGDPIRYRSFPMQTPPDQRDTKNPTYDLWSTGGSPPDREKWITNWTE